MGPAYCFNTSVGNAFPYFSILIYFFFAQLLLPFPLLHNNNHMDIYSTCICPAVGLGWDGMGGGLLGVILLLPSQDISNIYALPVQPCRLCSRMQRIQEAAVDMWHRGARGWKMCKQTRRPLLSSSTVLSFSISLFFILDKSYSMSAADNRNNNSNLAKLLIVFFKGFRNPKGDE